jgi:hypothetical protein
MKSYVPIPLSMLMPGVFNDERKFILVTNASLRLTFAANPFIRGIQVITSVGALANAVPSIM